jgi:phosphonate dehydrogenase
MRGRKARVVTHWVHPEVGDYLAGFCDAVMPARDEGVWPKPRLAADADGLMACMADSIDEAFLAGCRRLRVVSATLKGYDNFDAEACTRRGVWLTIVPDTLIAPTGELAIGLVIGLMRRITEGHDHVRGGGFAGWRPQLYGSTLQGATVGVLGMGQLGQAVARRLAGFGSQVAYHDARRLDAQTERALAVSYHGLAQLAEASDVIVVALPLTSQTRHLVDAPLLQRGPTEPCRSAILVRPRRTCQRAEIDAIRRIWHPPRGTRSRRGTRGRLATRPRLAGQALRLDGRIRGRRLVNDGG